MTNIIFYLGSTVIAFIVNKLVMSLVDLSFTFLALFLHVFIFCGVGLVRRDFLWTEACVLLEEEKSKRRLQKLGMTPLAHCD